MGSLYPLSQETLETIDHYSRELRLEMDRLLSLTYYPIAVASALFFVFVYKVISPNISNSLFPRYATFSRMEAMEWNSRVVSNVHAIIVCSICLHELLFDVGVRKNPIWCESCLVRINCGIVIGYLMADLVIMMLNWSYIGEMFFVLHHLITIYAYYYVMSYGVLPWFANFRLLSELSTPFVNQRWFFDVLGLRKTKGYAINAVMLFTSFFFVRIGTMPVYYYKLYSVYEFPAFQALGMLRYVAVIAAIILDSINIFWFSKIFKGAKKLYFASSEPRNSRQGSADAKERENHVVVDDDNEAAATVPRRQRDNNNFVDDATLPPPPSSRVKAGMDKDVVTAAGDAGRSSKLETQKTGRRDGLVVVEEKSKHE